MCRDQKILTAGICEYQSHSHIGKPLIPIIQCCQLCVINDPFSVIQKQYVHTSKKEDVEKKVGKILDYYIPSTGCCGRYHLRYFLFLTRRHGSVSCFRR